MGRMIIAPHYPGRCRVLTGCLLSAPLYEGPPVEMVGTAWLAQEGSFLRLPWTRGSDKALAERTSRRGDHSPHRPPGCLQRESLQGICDLVFSDSVVALTRHSHKQLLGITCRCHTWVSNPSPKLFTVLCTPLRECYTFILLAFSEKSNGLQRLNVPFEEPCWFN